jgi:hypothetical protein
MFQNLKVEQLVKFSTFAFTKAFLSASETLDVKVGAFETKVFFLAQFTATSHYITQMQNSSYSLAESSEKKIIFPVLKKETKSCAKNPPIATTK